MNIKNICNSVAAFLMLSLSFASASDLVRTGGIKYSIAETETGKMTLRLDMIQPEKACKTARPLVIMIHGGGFKSGERSTGTHKRFAHLFAQFGWSSASISYPLAKDQPIPSAPFARVMSQARGVEEATKEQLDAAAAAMEATVAAMDYFKQRASELCIDPSRIALMGSSAGAGTALRVAYLTDDMGVPAVKPAAVIDFWGGYRVDSKSITSGDAPLFIVHGTRDFTVPFEEATGLYQRLASVGVPVQLHAFKDKGHGWGQINGDSLIKGRQMEEVVREWLDEIFSSRTPKTFRTMN